MDISKFMEENTSYIFSVNSVSIDFVLKNIETGTMFLNDLKEKEIQAFKIFQEKSSEVYAVDFEFVCFRKA